LNTTWYQTNNSRAGDRLTLIRSSSRDATLGCDLPRKLRTPRTTTPSSQQESIAIGCNVHLYSSPCFTPRSNYSLAIMHLDSHPPSCNAIMPLNHANVSFVCHPPNIPPLIPLAVKCIISSSALNHIPLIIWDPWLNHTTHCHLLIRPLPATSPQIQSSNHLKRTPAQDKFVYFSSA
jgi:hypothetical protein